MKKIVSLIILTAIMLTTVFGLSSCSDIKVIGINQYGEHPSLDNCRTGFIKGLQEAGLVEGVDFKINYQNAGFDDSISGQIAQSFVSQKVDLMCGIATPSAIACFAAAEGTDIPTVFNAISDPESANLTTGNITGVSDKLPVTAQLDLIRRIQPNATKIGIIYTLSEPNSVSTIEDYKNNASAYGFTIVSEGVTAQSEVTAAVDNLISKKVDCFSNLTDNNVVGVLATILEKTNEAGIPVYGSEIEQVKMGCIVSAGIDYYELGKKCGEMAAKILKGELKASQIKYETVSKFETYINSPAAQNLKITFPISVTDNAIEATN